MKLYEKTEERMPRSYIIFAGICIAYAIIGDLAFKGNDLMMDIKLALLGMLALVSVGMIVFRVARKKKEYITNLALIAVSCALLMII